MRKVAFSIILVISIGFVVAGCGKKSEHMIIGNWVTDETREVMSFYKDNTIVINYINEGATNHSTGKIVSSMKATQVVGEYTFIDENHVKISLGGAVTIVQVSFTAKDEIIITDPEGVSENFKRVIDRKVKGIGFDKKAASKVVGKWQVDLREDRVFKRFGFSRIATVLEFSPTGIAYVDGLKMKYSIKKGEHNAFTKEECNESGTKYQEKPDILCLEYGNAYTQWQIGWPITQAQQQFRLSELELPDTVLQFAISYFNKVEN